MKEQMKPQQIAKQAKKTVEERLKHIDTRLDNLLERLQQKAKA